MKKNILHLFRLVSLLFVIAGCQQELQDPDGNNPPNPPPGGPTVNDNIMVQAGVRGIVVDERNIPVQGAVVTSGSHTVTTDRYGSFVFNNISLSKSNGNVKVSKPGYFTGVRSFITTAGRIHNVRIKLLPKTNSGNFNSSSGGTINAIGGARLTMPANAVADANGILYTGAVNVSMIWIDPSSNDLPFAVPGDLRGITTGGDERGLETFGMIGVELTGATGQPLNIAAGKKADLSFPIPTPLQANAPATIDLWHFDEAKARWIQDGTATKSGANYIASVSHFSFWNCDAPFPLVEVCMTLVNADGAPLNNVQVRIKRPNGSYGYGRTDSLGNLCGKVPKNEALVLEVLGQCNNVVHTQNIGPFSSDASLGVITLTLPSTSILTITGTLVNCSNANVASGVVIIYTANGFSYSVPVSNGTFSHNILRCDNNALNFSVLGIDYTASQQSGPVSGSGTIGTVNIGTIQACGASSVEYIEFLINGVPFTYTAPPDVIYLADSTGTTNNFTIFATKGPPNNSNTTFASFRFANTGSTGTVPLEMCRFNAVGIGLSEVIATSNPTVNLTTLGPPVTGYIEGNFNIQMNFTDGSTRTVVCSFRKRRG